MTPDNLHLVEWAACALIIAGGSLWLAAKTALLRDTDPTLPNFVLRPYSLSKSQLLFWSVVISTMYLYLLIVMGKVDIDFNATVLELLGISVVTTGLVATQTPTPKPTAPSLLRPLPVPIGAPTPPPAVAPPPTPSPRHKTYIDDILSDSQGMNVHRLQMVIWTVIFGGYFIHGCLQNGVFPVFDDKRMALLGLGSGTYVWFRRTEP